MTEHAIAAGVDGVVVLGSTGEFTHLGRAERRAAAQVTTTTAAGRVPVIVGVGAAGTREAAELASEAADVGADAVVAVSPYYWRVGDDGLADHFVAVADATDLPTLIYNFPLLTGHDLGPDLVCRLAASRPDIVGIKDTVTECAHTVTVLREVRKVRPDFAVLVGFEDQILPAMLAGADGAISGLSNVAPDLFVALMRAAAGNDLAAAAALHRRVLALMELYELSSPGMGAVKAAMAARGLLDSAAVRGPASPVAPRDRDAVLAVLAAAEIGEVPAA